MKKDGLMINGQITTAEEFAYDGCHKIYLIESEQDKHDAIECGYDIFPISELLNKYAHSCELRFIYNWELSVRYVMQFEDADIQKVVINERV